MKPKRNHQNNKPAGSPLEPVRFEFVHPSASSVCLAGTFNGWRPDAKPLRSLGDGRWVGETVLPPGNYEYCLVVDGQWMPDPLASETVPNPFGGSNSLLKVAGSPFCPPAGAIEQRTPVERTSSYGQSNAYNQP